MMLSRFSDIMRDNASDQQSQFQEITPFPNIDSDCLSNPNLAAFSLVDVPTEKVLRLVRLNELEHGAAAGMHSLPHAIEVKTFRATAAGIAISQMRTSRARRAGTSASRARQLVGIELTEVIPGWGHSR